MVASRSWRCVKVRSLAISSVAPPADSDICWGEGPSSPMHIERRWAGGLPPSVLLLPASGQSHGAKMASVSCSTGISCSMKPTEQSTGICSATHSTNGDMPNGGVPLPSAIQMCSGAHNLYHHCLCCASSEANSLQRIFYLFFHRSSGWSHSFYPSWHHGRTRSSSRASE